MEGVAVTGPQVPEGLAERLDELTPSAYLVMEVLAARPWRWWVSYDGPNDADTPADAARAALAALSGDPK